MLLDLQARDDLDRAAHIPDAVKELKKYHAEDPRIVESWPETSKPKMVVLVCSIST